MLETSESDVPIHDLILYSSKPKRFFLIQSIQLYKIDTGTR